MPRHKISSDVRSTMTPLHLVGLFVIFLCLSPLVAAYDAIRFRGGGIYFWWQAGAAQFLLERGEDFAQQPLYGTSAGALSATLFASGASMQDAATLAIDLATEKRVWDRPAGLAGVWGEMIEDWLEELVPEDIPQESLSRLNIVVTPRRIWKGPQLINGFTSKAELIDATMASAHIPFFLDKKPWRSYKEKKYIDGSFWQFIVKAKEKYPNEDSKLNILDVDFNDDEVFKLQLEENSSIVKLITPAGLYSMMDYGYEYMKRTIG